MGKAEKNSEGMPGISPQTEASKLLEQALLQMDGIISGLQLFYAYVTCYLIWRLYAYYHVLF